MREYDLYVTVIPSHGLKAPSYAQDFLVQKIEQRRLRSFCMKYDVAHTDVYRMAIGTRQPGYYIMKTLRFVIPPIWWFTEVDDKKPRIRHLDKNVKNPSFKNSKAFKTLMKISIKDWVYMGFGYQPIYCLKKGKINNITFTRMQEFAPKINVQDWFIFLD